MLVLVLGQVVLVLGQVVLALGVQVWVLRRDRSGSRLSFEETCNQTSGSNVVRFANSMSMRCIRLGPCMLRNTPDVY